MKTPVDKQWKQRTSGIMKKAHGMHWTFGVKVALYLERDGELFVYRSHEDFAWEAATFLAKQILTPNDFITLAQDMSSRRAQQSTPLPSSEQGPPQTPVSSSIPTPVSTPGSSECSVTGSRAPRRTRSHATTLFNIAN
ncbi:uncharacterized protein G6M90_00g069230 [Metarhizium brunneum]|uniref:MADS-box domain-containing protein n=2 Tax=Metarhizium TaxID=5529 RepID=A0A7D5UZX2_9HYPO|nr:Ankyrin repeat-containing domain protein [Metarhizium robertsii ARSEF 23]KAF5128394.1 hypothetical protein E5D57_009333 [Metarhizium anisopliae]KHO10621.1 Ankyrin repeat-containing domain protein [Metarhizium robertsii ARSEF 23]QLI70179.1 hypothetical protein G6M90_00g068480 [Metarhizium brunneum]QLI71339.1 hypothetical protein G6M90_00g069230 [Metarhizium brunneum]